MSRPYWKARHVDTRALLPAKLERGRAYFVDDEQIIIIDHGTGPVEYGGKPGPQGQAGEPIPSLQGQINELASAALQTSITLTQINNRRKADTENLKRVLLELTEMTTQADTNNASAILSLANIISKLDAKLSSEIAILTHAIVNMYPATHTAQAGDPNSPMTAGEIISTSDGYHYVIDQSYFDGDSGVIVISFTDNATLPRIATLNEGDNLIVDSTNYTVTHKTGSASQGIISLTVAQS